MGYAAVRSYQSPQALKRKRVLQFGVPAILAAVALLVFWGVDWQWGRDSEAAPHLERREQNLAQEMVQTPAAPTVKVSVGGKMGPVGVEASRQMTSEEFAKEMKGLERAVKFDVSLARNLAAQADPRMKKHNQWAIEIENQGLIGREFDYVLRGGMKADFRRLDIAKLLRGLPSEERELLYDDWLDQRGILKAKKESSIPILEDICRRYPDNPAAQKIMAIVDYSKENGLFL
ncbi:MAG: hypothetical protein PWQ57_2419 [Desulfovibrionales bacterium]|jgi:hypothetical protein|nr:hypothetical protein [Desulfovibrionales bacterium]